MITLTKNLKNWNYNCGAQDMRRRYAWSRRLLTLVLLLSCLHSGTAQTLPTIPPDKMLHFGAGYVIASGTAAALHYRGVKNADLWGLGAGVAAGVIKELIDDRADPADAYATMWGALVGSIVISIPIHNEKRYDKKRSNRMGY